MNKKAILLFFGLIPIFASIAKTPSKVEWKRIDDSAKRQRLVVLADMGNEPDEEQQIMHLLMYSNEFDIEGLIAVTGKFLNPNSDNPSKKRLYPEYFDKIIDGYSLIYDNLKLHDNNYPTPEYLHRVVARGQIGYGSEAVGKGLSSEGSNLLIKCFENRDNRPIFIVVNAGSNTLAQAIFDYSKVHTSKATSEMISRLRVFENGAQDDAGAWICHNYPNIYWIRSNYQAYCYGGPSVDGGKNNKGKNTNLGPYTWEPYAYSGLGQHQWALENIISGHGPYGKYWPLRIFPKGGISFIEGGGTIPWFCLANKGLSYINHLDWGGWSGLYSSLKQLDCWSKHESVKKDEIRYSPFYMYAEKSDNWKDPESKISYNSIYLPVWRWRRAFMNDFKYRMDWCIKSYNKANHNPVAVVDNDNSDCILTSNAKEGEKIMLDASNSYDPDGNILYYEWFFYKEAGTYNGSIHIHKSSSSKTYLVIPKYSLGKTIHIILEVRDNERKKAMFDYRRLIINVI